MQEKTSQIVLLDFFKGKALEKPGGNGGSKTVDNNPSKNYTLIDGLPVTALIPKKSFLFGV
jgi:hypothetical protein